MREGPPMPRQLEHDFNPATDVCRRCGVTAAQLQDSSGPIPCSPAATSPYLPTKAEQAATAAKAIELYDAIQTMCGENKACPEPFASLYSILMRERFNLERMKIV